MQKYFHTQSEVNCVKQSLFYICFRYNGWVGSFYIPAMVWITAMEFCAKHSQAPFDPGKNYQPNKKWTGTGKYHMSIGKEFQLFDT